MKKFVLSFLLACTVLPLWADVSPKPEMQFTFIYNTADKSPIAPDASEQIQCEDNQCMDPKPLGTYGLQKLYCSADKCFSIAYGYAHYQKLIIGFEDGTKKGSNIFKTPAALRSSFNVYVNPDNLEVQLSPVQKPYSNLVRRDAWASLLIILLLELAAAWASISYMHKPLRILYAVAGANILSMFATWFFLAGYIRETAFLWIFCLLFESVFIWAFNRKYLTLTNAFNLSLATNVTSYSLGMMISFWIAPWLF